MNTFIIAVKILAFVSQCAFAFAGFSWLLLGNASLAALGLTLAINTHLVRTSKWYSN